MGPCGWSCWHVNQDLFLTGRRLLTPRVHTLHRAGSARLYLVKELKELGAGLVDGTDDGAAAQGQGLHEGQHLEAGRAVQATGSQAAGGQVEEEETERSGVKGALGVSGGGQTMVVNVTQHCARLYSASDCTYRP